MYSVDDEIDDWQNLDLETPPPPPEQKVAVVIPPLNLQFDYTDLQEQYKKILQRTKVTASTLASLTDVCWEALPQTPIDHVQLYTLREHVLRPVDCSSYYTLQARGVILGRPERLAYAARNCTKWDTHVLEMCQWQTFTALNAHYVTARIAMPSNAIMRIEDRWVGGLLFFDRHKASDVYRVLFRSAVHPVHGTDAPPGTRFVEAMVALFFKAVDGERTKVTMVIDIHQAPAGVWLTSTAKERLCENVRSWIYGLEQAVLDWDTIYKASH